MSGGKHRRFGGKGCILLIDDPPGMHLAEDKEKLTGAGLRLAIVRHLAQQMRGDLGLFSVNGTATLRLQIPGA